MPNVKNECVNMLILQKLKYQGRRKSGGSYVVYAGKHLRNWTKTSIWSDFNKAATKWFKRCCKVLVHMQISAPVLKLAVFVQHRGSPSAFRQNSAEWHWNKFIISNPNDQRYPQHSQCPFHSTCKFSLSMFKLLMGLFLDQAICFLEILILLINVTFLKKQPRILIVPKNHHNLKVLKSIYWRHCCIFNCMLRYFVLKNIFIWLSFSRCFEMLSYFLAFFL